jgi:hypothetical protein
MTRIAEYPLELGRPSMKSMERYIEECCGIARESAPESYACLGTIFHTYRQ